MFLVCQSVYGAFLLRCDNTKDYLRFLSLDKKLCSESPQGKQCNFFIVNANEVIY